MLTLRSRVRYDGHDCIVVGRTIEAHSRYDLLFLVSRRIEQNVPEKDLEPCSIDHSLQLTGPSSHTVPSMLTVQLLQRRRHGRD
jgi:hypothetical protein